MLVYKKKKFLRGEKSKELKPEAEISALNHWLHSMVLPEENYELAALIKSRLDKIELERNSY